MKKILSIFTVISLFAAVLLSSSCAGLKTGDEVPASETAARVESEPSEELCALWIATVMNINFPSYTGLSAEKLRCELDLILSTAEGLGANAVFFQVRGAGDAYYDSKIFPTSKYIVKNEGDPLPDGFDVLEYLVENAHAKGIAVHAWVNPLRATIGVSELSELSPNNPAALHPDYVIRYADNRFYYDAGMPEVRRLVADGVSEIVSNYGVDGIVFDDYFYPYPVTDDDGNIIAFDDASTFDKYGEDGETLYDFRRRSINLMVEESYNAVKSANPDCRFGVAPAGIWKNGTGGSDGSSTRGMSSYYDIYCDSLAWVEGGYVDYLAPQIYWSFDSEYAPFSELCEWWDTALDGTGVDYYISYAAYRYEDDWDEPSGEMTDQVNFARLQSAYRGGAFYGYRQIANNVFGIADELKLLFKNKITYK